MCSGWCVWSRLAVKVDGPGAGCDLYLCDTGWTDVVG